MGHGKNPFLFFLCAISLPLFAPVKGTGFFGAKAGGIPFAAQRMKKEKRLFSTRFLIFLQL